MNVPNENDRSAFVNLRSDIWSALKKYVLIEWGKIRKSGSDRKLRERELILRFVSFGQPGGRRDPRGCSVSRSVCPNNSARPTSVVLLPSMWYDKARQQRRRHLGWILRAERYRHRRESPNTRPTPWSRSARTSANIRPSMGDRHRWVD